MAASCMRKLGLFDLRHSRGVCPVSRLKKFEKSLSLANPQRLPTCAMGMSELKRHSLAFFKRDIRMAFPGDIPNASMKYL